MNDGAASIQATTLNKKERSPSFPFIGLTKAVERARTVLASARRHEVRVVDLATTWGMGAKSSGTLQTIAALLAYGLLEDQGSGESRKLKITDLAFRALEDQRPGARDTALSEAAMKPRLILEYAEKWKDGRPSDGICISELRIDRGFTDDGAKLFLKVFDDTIRFAKPLNSDKKSDAGSETVRQNSAGVVDQKVQIGDLIQWTSGGVDQLKQPGRVMWIAEDGSHLRVHGSQTGIPMNEVNIAKVPERSHTQQPATVADVSSNRTGSVADISVLMNGRQLEITATVDANGLKTLKEMLSQYEAILALLDNSNPQ